MSSSKYGLVCGIALLAGAAPAQGSAGTPCAAIAGVYGSPPSAREAAEVRRFVHAVARREGVDPYALEAIGMVETGLRPAIGAACELGAFQIMPSWSETFQLASPAYFYDLRVGAVAAARVYKHGLERWRPRYAGLAKHRCLRGAGLSARKLERLVFGAATYNYGKLPELANNATTLGATPIPDSTCRYVARFERELAAARARGPI